MGFYSMHLDRGSLAIHHCFTSTLYASICDTHFSHMLIVAFDLELYL